MTQRISVECDTCSQGIVFRVGIGGEKIQLFSVACPKCKQKVGLELLLNSKPSSFEGIPMKHFMATVKEYINCHYKDEEADFIPINLHAELVYPKIHINEKFLIPSTMVAQTLMEHAEKKGIFNYDDLTNPTPFGPSFISVFDALSGDANLSSDWFIIKKAYQLNEAGLNDLSQKELEKYSNLASLPKNGRYLENIISDFLFRYIAPNTKLYIDIEDEFEKARNLNNHELKELSDYYKNDLKKFHLKNYIEIFDDYFNNYKDFNRILLNNKIELHPESGTESIICPIDFDKIKMYYGNAYEFFTSHIITLVCVNNILQNRKYDQFEHMTFNKYLKDVSKESKSKPLHNNVNLKKFTDILESTIRNASHHKWFYVDETNIGMLKYRSGGTGAEQTISYVDYLYKCNEITMRLAVLLLIEIYLIEY
ncbi:hypothetical protein CRV02_01155 [Arcobacter sp. CECT 8989]|uniref:hypothetical protein n=1 Tax=Arcobacter sp. CECT 8989 TaxID=2044509 RepID=UPI00100B7F30|nr:hypothetical protein [Arcobacter sp. CECT 8989]RXK03832.1 hypothetical protein CRV02_01155 [Arcobacter sp. CECT 8989]